MNAQEFDQLRRDTQQLLQDAAAQFKTGSDAVAQASENLALLRYENPTVKSAPVPVPTPVPNPPSGSVITVRTSSDLRQALEGEGDRTVRIEDDARIGIGSPIRIRHGGLTLLPSRCQVFSDNNKSQLIQVHAPYCNLEGLFMAHGVGVGEGNCCGDNLSLGPGAHHCTLRRMSFVHGVDECMDAWGDDINNITISECIFAHALGDHSMGIIVGGGVSRDWVFERNLMMDNNNRNPYIAVDNLLVLNNFIYRNRARAIQAFGRYARQEQHYVGNFVFHEDAQEGSWGSANAGDVGDGTLVLHARGNLNNTTRKTEATAEREFWSADASDGRNALPYIGPLEASTLSPDALSAMQVWDSIRDSVGAVYRSQQTIDMIREIDKQWGQYR